MGFPHTRIVGSLRSQQMQAPGKGGRENRKQKHIQNCEAGGDHETGGGASGAYDRREGDDLLSLPFWQ